MSWNIVRYTATHRQIMHLILATLTLKRYHLIWFNSTQTQLQMTLTIQSIPISDTQPLPPLISRHPYQSNPIFSSWTAPRCQSSRYTATEQTSNITTPHNPKYIRILAPVRRNVKGIFSIDPVLPDGLHVLLEPFP